jgi:hypothetical protein
VVAAMPQPKIKGNSSATRGVILTDATYSVLISVRQAVEESRHFKNCHVDP